MKMSSISDQKPSVAVGTKLAVGTVTAINSDHVLIDTLSGSVKKFTFHQVEGFVNVSRSLSGS
jgi:hypothetical protein